MKDVETLRNSSCWPVATIACSRYAIIMDEIVERIRVEPSWQQLVSETIHSINVLLNQSTLSSLLLRIRGPTACTMSADKISGERAKVEDMWREERRQRKLKQQVASSGSDEEGGA